MLYLLHFCYFHTLQHLLNALALAIVMPIGMDWLWKVLMQCMAIVNRKGGEGWTIEVVYRVEGEG